ncbi:MAG: transporter substrate-binding domain-containing protein [Synergistaceae bacterium]|nr:transporter substrate-binding domain-containing protein [Synergistaceae bacterium]
MNLLSLLKKVTLILLVIFWSFSESFAINSISQLNDEAVTIVASESGAFVDAVKKDLPKAKILNLSGQPAYDAVKMGKADAYAFDRQQMEIAISEGLKGVKILSGSIGEKNEIAIGISKASKIPGLKEKINKFISELKNSGTFQDMRKRWLTDRNFTMPDIKMPSSPELKITIGTVGLIMPYSYYEGNKLTGFDIELGKRLAAWLGAELEFRDYDYGGVITAASAGDIDCIMADLNIPPERAEKIDFSDVLFTEEIALMVKDDVYSSVSALAGKRVAVVTGSTHPDITLKFVPTAELVYFNSIPDTFTALKTGKVDAICTGIPIAKLIMAEDDSIAFFGEQLTHVEGAPIFAKNENGRKLCDEFSEFLKKQWENGTIQELDLIWFGNDESRKIIKDYSKLPAPNGVLKMAADVSIPPCTYVKDNMIVGYDVDCAVRFCEAYGYGLEIIPMNFNGVIPAVQTGKCDFGMGAITRTDEREESVLFSYPNMKSGNSFVVRKPETKPKNLGKYSKFEDLANKKIGVQTGTLGATLVAQQIPTAKIEYFDALSDVLIALKTGKVDALTCTIFAAKDMINNNDDLIYLDQWLRTSDLSPIFTKSEKGQKLCEEYSKFLKSLWDDGTMKNLEAIWLGKDESKKIVKDYSKLPAPNGVLKMGVDTSWPPLAYIKDNRVVGYDVDIAVRFCEAHGYGLEVFPTSVSGMIAAVQTGKCDFSQSMNFTEERAQVSLFSSTPSAHAGNVIIVLKDENSKASAFQDLSGKKIGIILGANHDIFVAEKIPDAQIEYFNDLSAVTLALQTGKIAAFTNTLPTAIYMTHEHKDMSYISEPLENTYTYSAFTNSDKGQKICSEYSEFIKSLWDNGTIKQLSDKWIYSEDEQLRTIEDYSKLPADNGILRMAIDTGRMPFAYVKDNKIIGYDIEIASMFCKSKGYGLEVYPMDFAGILGSIKTGKCDLTGSITRTEERAETMLFSPVPNAETPIVLIVMKSAETEKNVEPERNIFIDELKASFERTFIREDRWKLFADGIISTMIITVMSIFFGTILGFIVYLSCRGGNIVANLITRFFIWLIQGMPMVVLLMILYYIIFGKVDIAGIWVAVIAFTLTFGSSVYGMLVSGVKALDAGQLEAAYALGFTDRRAFFTIILPQAALHFMPSYKAAVVALIKATAVVGYIAVQDLTKMGDIVRSRTYEAFFPLIAVAIIYFVLAGILNIIVGIIHNKIRPEKRTKSDILRGIEIHD